MRLHQLHESIDSDDDLTELNGLLCQAVRAGYHCGLARWVVNPPMGYYTAPCLAKTPDDWVGAADFATLSILLRMAGAVVLTKPWHSDQEYIGHAAMNPSHAQQTCQRCGCTCGIGCGCGWMCKSCRDQRGGSAEKKRKLNHDIDIFNVDTEDAWGEGSCPYCDKSIYVVFEKWKDLPIDRLENIVAHHATELGPVAKEIARCLRT